MSSQRALKQCVRSAHQHRVRLQAVSVVNSRRTYAKRAPVKRQPSAAVQHTIGGIFEPFLQQEAVTKTPSPVISPRELLEGRTAEELLPSEEHLEMLIKQKQTTLSIEKQKELVNLVLDHYRKEVGLADLTKVAGSAGELAALGNIVLRGSKYGAPVALELYRAAMDAGDDRGAFSFANMVYRGYRGTEKNEDLGIRILSELARKGHPYAQMNLASILMRTQADQVPAAIKLYELAARSIDSAYVELGRMYRIGYGVHQDHTKAMQYFEKGAQKGNAQCNFMLGVYYSTPGKVVDLDQAKAFKYFQKAAMRGLPEAQYNVGLRFLKGHGVETHPYNAAEFFRMAAMQGFQLAQANLANMYLQGHGVKKDMDEGRTWLSKAAERGGSIGEECKKRLNELDGIPQDKPRCNIM